MNQNCSFLLKNSLAVMTGLAGKDARAGSTHIRVRDGYILAMSPDLAPLPGERIIDATGCVVYPGWVNTHHHLFQSLLKGVPAGINQPLSGWLAKVPYPHLPRYDAAAFKAAAQLGLVELLLSGTTTCADHHYVYHGDLTPETADVLFEAAEELGMRFVLCRGGTLQTADHPGFSSTTMRPETLDAMMRDIERLKSRYHDAASDAMRRIVVAPTTPTFSLPPHLLREVARGARALGLRMHTHLSETQDYVTFCRERYNQKPMEFMAEHEWLGPDIWFAHLVHVSESEIDMLAQTGSGLAHCPSSNCRLGSGVAPVPAMAAKGVPISLGVDGAASNEASTMTGEARLAWLVHRAVQGPTATTVENVAHWGTAGGARVLGLDGVGTLEPGKAADLAVYDLGGGRYLGHHDPAAAPVISGEPATLRYVFVQGRLVVEDGTIPDWDLEALRARVLAAMTRISAAA